MKVNESAFKYLRAGLSALPANLIRKQPALSWKKYQHELPSPDVIVEGFSKGADAVCVICGEVSGNLEAIDFDAEGRLFNTWLESVKEDYPQLADKLCIERTPSGGYHVIYRCEQVVEGNKKLAHERTVYDTDDEVTRYGKTLRPRKTAEGVYEIVVTTIETRGEGGLILCAPSPGYKFIRRSLEDVQTISRDERDVLIAAARSLNEHWPHVVGENKPTSAESTKRPGDDFNDRGDVRQVLIRHGWALHRAGENEYWRRPGKNQSEGHSATLKNGVFYVFSSNAYPFEADRAYAPFAVYAFLEHSGNYSAAAKALRKEGYGSSHVESVVVVEECESVEPVEPIDDPGPVPLELLRVPGLVSETSDYSLATAPYPNPVLAFCGAMTLVAFLVGRKFQDPGGNRTNIYLLGLAHSGSGKDWPRKVNVKIIHGIGLSAALGDRFASGQGIEDAMLCTPSMLFQTDEIDTILESINGSPNALHEGMLATLLTMYSSASSIYSMRRRAIPKSKKGDDKGDEEPQVIIQPNLVIFGTATPNHFYRALSERFLSNGFFARMIVLESGLRSEGQEPKIIEIPERILKQADWLAKLPCGEGNLSSIDPHPRVVEATPEAMRLITDVRVEVDGEYLKAQRKNDIAGTTVWARVTENVRKMALIYAISENPMAPEISGDAVNWAYALMMHLARRMLAMTEGHVADNPFHALCLKCLSKIRESGSKGISRSNLLRQMRLDAPTVDRVIITLNEQGDIVADKVATGGRTAVRYSLAGARRVKEVKEGVRRG